MSTRSVLLIAALSITTNGLAAVYLCKDQYGRPQFSQTPCGTDAKEIEIRHTSVPKEVESTDADAAKSKLDSLLQSEQSTRNERELKELEQKITRLESKKKRLQRERDDKIKAEESKPIINTPANMIALNTWRQNVREEYSIKIKEVEDEILKLKETKELLQ